MPQSGVLKLKNFTTPVTRSFRGLMIVMTDGEFVKVIEEAS